MGRIKPKNEDQSAVKCPGIAPIGLSNVNRCYLLYSLCRKRLIKTSPAEALGVPNVRRLWAHHDQIIRKLTVIANSTLVDRTSKAELHGYQNDRKRNTG